MDVRDAYNRWAEQYDTNKNRTRDLEGQALRTVLAGHTFENCLEIGCGTGKNTVWLLQKVKHVTAVDLSEEMLAKAKEKVKAEQVSFVQADITQDWTFTTGTFDLVGFSLVLEHIQDLEHVFKEAALALKPGGYVYVGELHPFKQYAGTKARFEDAAGQHEIVGYTHHVSEFVQTASEQGLALCELQELFDEDDRSGIPRILALLFRKS